MNCIEAGSSSEFYEGKSILGKIRVVFCVILKQIWLDIVVGRRVDFRKLVPNNSLEIQLVLSGRR